MKRWVGLLALLLFFVITVCARMFPNQERYPDLKNPLMPSDYTRDPLLYSYGREWGDKSPEKHGGPTEQVNLPFRLTFYGGLYNYTIVSTDGFIAFAPPPQARNDNPQFPNPRYPQEPDPPFLAPFYSRTGLTRRSDVFYRAFAKGQTAGTAPVVAGQQRKRYYENDLILEMAQRDIQFGMAGAAEFVPVAGFLVTWSNATFEGKAFDDDRLESERVPENTFQLLVVTDEETQTYAIFNYKNISWTTHSGHSALVGFNGGNGSGFWELAPFSRDPRLAQIDEGTNINFTGRYVFRVDEVIQPAGCMEEVDQGKAYAAPSGGSMLGGDMINVTGPCFLPTSQIRCKFGQHETQGIYISPVQARCITPMMFEVGWRELGVSVDVQHNRVPPGIKLLDVDDWFLASPPTHLTMEWNPKNITWADGLRIDIGVWGYREENNLPEMKFLANIATNVSSDQMVHWPNDYRRYRVLSDGNKWYQFSPSDLVPSRFDANFTYGFLRINATGASSTEYPHLWSESMPLAWYLHKQWRRDYGNDYVGHLCRDWDHRDRALPQFTGDLDPCPCTLDQALADKGRFSPEFECDYDSGGGTCQLHKQAIHCVHGPVHPQSGAGQECCYDREGKLLLTNDSRWAGSPNRAPPCGVSPYHESRKVPSLSNWFHDNMPWFFCCQWSDDCYDGKYRLASHDCAGYRPPTTAIMFGHSHVITFDGTEYGFHGKGDYVLLKSDLLQYQINVQARLEQPPRQSFGYINSTVIRAVAMQENDSDVIEIQAREPHKRWRYRLQILVNGQPRYFDQPWSKVQTFKGVSIQSHESAVYQSISESVVYELSVVVRFASGIGIEVKEVQGYLHVIAYVPPEIQNHSTGLFGKWNGIPEDDFTTANGIKIPVTATPRAIHSDFAQTWHVQNDTGRSLFQKAANTQLIKRGEEWLPIFDEPEYPPQNTTLRMLEVDLMCGPRLPDNKECRYDYLVTANRHIAEATAQAKLHFVAMRNKLKGSLKGV